MEIKITTNQILKVLQVISWILFIGLCIEAGALITHTAIAFFINPSGVRNFWQGADYLTALYAFEQGHFAIVALLMIIVAVLKAIMFYGIIKLFSEKKISISQPFSTVMVRFILNQSYLALGIGLFSHSASNYCDWLVKQGMATADLETLNLEGSDIWLFMAVILFLIVQVVKRGIEIQNENDLTI